MQLYLLRCNTLQKISELSSFHVIFIEDRASRFALPVFRGCIDIGDGCCRRMVLVTTIRCCWQFWPFWSPTSTIFLHKRRAPTSQRCHQHRNSATNIPKSSSTLSHQHHCYRLSNLMKNFGFSDVVGNGMLTTL